MKTSKSKPESTLKGGAKGSGQVRNPKGDTDTKILYENDTQDFMCFQKGGKVYLRAKPSNLTMRVHNTKKGLVLHQVLP